MRNEATVVSALHSLYNTSLHAAATIAGGGGLVTDASPDDTYDIQYTLGADNDNSTACEYRGGRAPIKPPLAATVGALILLTGIALVVLHKKGWTKYELVTPIMMQQSHVVSRPAHGAYRIGVFMYTFSIMMYAIWLREHNGHVGWDLRYFTIWNYTTLVILFALLSVEHVFTYTPQWLSRFTWVLFQVELTNALFLDLVYWTVLFPLGNKAAILAMPDFFITVNVHAINSVLLIGEVVLGRLVMVPAHIMWVATYSLAYVVVTWINYSETADCMPYPFMSAKTSDAPAVYVVMCIGISIIYAIVYKVVQLKNRALGSSEDEEVYHGYAPIA